MTCSHYEDLIDKMSCRDIHPEEQEQLTDHIVTCRPCSTKYAEAKNFVNVMVQALHSVSATPDREQIARSLERVQPAKPQPRWAPWAVAASLIIAFAFVWLLGRSQNQRSEDELAHYARLHSQPNQGEVISADALQNNQTFTLVLPQYLPEGFKLVRTSRVDKITIQMYYQNSDKTFSLFEERQVVREELLHEERIVNQTRVILDNLGQNTLILVSSDLDFDELRKILDSMNPPR